MWTDLLATLYYPGARYLLWLGAQLIAGGITAIWLTRKELILGPDPQIPSPPVFVPTKPHYRVEEVFPRIPGATPEAGPRCPICGGPFHPVCPSAPKERTEETVVLPIVAPVVDLAPQFAALGRFFEAVDEARADTDEAMRRIAATVRPDCPLTTHEIEIPTVGEAPVHAGIASREPTRDLSAALEKVKQA